MTELQSIRRRPDGSIDTSHYIRRGRIQRSVAAHEAARTAIHSARKPAVGIATIVAFLPFIAAKG
jgi:hypothetical protein